MAEQRETGQQPETMRNVRPPADSPDDVDVDKALEQEGAGPSDDQRNPGIGLSKGTTMAGADADDLDEEMSDADNTVEGDVENDAGRAGGGVDPNRTGRHNA